MVKLLCFVLLFCCSVPSIAVSEKESCVSKCMKKHLKANTDEEMDKPLNRFYDQALIGESDNKAENSIKKICNCFKLEKCKNIPDGLCE